MKSKIYSVFDSKANAFAQPFFMSNEAVMMRVIGDMRTEPSHNFNAHPEDFSIWEIGEYDDVTGIIEAAAPRCVVNVVNVPANIKPYHAEEIINSSEEA